MRYYYCIYQNYKRSFNKKREAKEKEKRDRANDARTQAGEQAVPVAAEQKPQVPQASL